MRQFRKFLVTSSVLFMLLFIDCASDHQLSCEFTPCTDIFKALVVSLRHTNDSTAIALTGYSVIRVSDNQDITIPDNDLTDNNGYYTITNDTKKDLFKFKNVEVEFTGFINKAILFQRRFIITADCCHITLVEGDTKIYL